MPKIMPHSATPEQAFCPAAPALRQAHAGAAYLQRPPLETRFSIGVQSSRPELFAEKNDAIPQNLGRLPSRHAVDAA
jgi:hypothetical protein